MNEPSSESDLDERIPCADELCTGILDASGVCGTCGRGGGDVSRTVDEVADTGPATDVEAREEALADERVPCADEMCVGIVGADGRCGVCGRAAAQ